MFDQIALTIGRCGNLSNNHRARRSLNNFIGFNYFFSFYFIFKSSVTKHMLTRIDSNVMSRNNHVVYFVMILISMSFKPILGCRFESKFNPFHSRKCIWKYRLQNIARIWLMLFNNYLLSHVERDSQNQYGLISFSNFHPIQRVILKKRVQQLSSTYTSGPCMRFQLNLNTDDLNHNYSKREFVILNS